MMIGAWQTVGVCVALTLVVILIDLMHSAGLFKSKQSGLASAARKARANRAAHSNSEGGSQ